MLETLLSHLSSRADRVVDVPILQNADPFLETAGEDLRRRIFTTESANGSLQCLRPEFTIPICLQHRGQAARYAYGGAVFRQGRKGSVEFQQVGLEDLGTSDTIAADIASVMDMRGALDASGIQNVSLTMGDQHLFAVLVRALELPAAIVERLERNFGAPDALARMIDEVSSKRSGGQIDDAIYAMAKEEDRAGLVALVETRMDEAGLSPRSGRKPVDIVDRMIDKARIDQFTLDDDQANKLRAFLELEAPLDRAVTALEDFSASHKVAFGKALDGFRQRLDGLQAEEFDLAGHTFRASFGRKLEYYTGLLFEAHADGVADSIAGGGRYDRLCSLLGAASPVPAVGFSITLDRLRTALKAQNGEGQA